MIINARIARDGQTLFEDVEIQIDIHPTGRLYRWDGTFEAPNGFSVLDREKYQFVFEDGRKGDFFVTRTHGSEVAFQGTGSIE